MRKRSESEPLQLSVGCHFHAREIALSKVPVNGKQTEAKPSIHSNLQRVPETCMTIERIKWKGPRNDVGSAENTCLFTLAEVDHSKTYLMCNAEYHVSQPPNLN